jgi:tetratricopeptide (TPR) repeat protein
MAVGAKAKPKAKTRQVVPQPPGLFERWFSSVNPLVIVGIIVGIVALIGKVSSAKAGPSDWIRLKKWMLEHGATIHDGVITARRSHGGQKIRGVVADVALEPGTVIFRVPKRVWLDQHSVQPASQTPVESIHDCADEDTRMIMMAAGMAAELRKGSKAFHAPALEMYPLLHVYRAYHPFLAEERAKEDFKGLPLLADLAADYYAETKALEKCFEAWVHASREEDPISQLQFDDFLLARFHIKTRSFFGSTIVPAVDLLNTGRKEKLNTQSSSNSGVFELKTTRHIAAGEELFLQYCAECDNEILLAGFGFYNEDNANNLNNLGIVDCPALESFATAELYLEGDAVEASLSNGWSAPRCDPRTRKYTDGSEVLQPAIRCSLARLAWESCAESWSKPGWKRSEAPPLGPAFKDHSKAHSNLGVALAMAGDLQGAASRFREALRIYPGWAEAHFNLAGMLAQQGDLEAAEASLQTALASNPSDVSISKTLEALRERQRNEALAKQWADKESAG